MSKVEQLRKELKDARERLVAKGWKWDGESGNLMDIKPFEIAYQEAIEKVFPDYIWWQLTNYWDIFDAMMGGVDDEAIIDEIIDHIDPSVLDENFEENEMGAKIESGHTIEEYREKFGEFYDNGELWDFSEEDLMGGAIDINPDIVYWKIEVDGEPRYFETCDVCVESDLEKEDDKAVAKLTEGASNFPVHSEFDLLVYYPIEEFYDIMRYDSDYPEEVNFEDDDGNVDYEAYEEAKEAFEEKYWEENEVCVLDEDSEERLQDRLDEFNSETKRIADERWHDDVDDTRYNDLTNLEDIKLKIAPGYYEAVYIEVDNENAIDYMSEGFGKEQKERIVNFLNEIRKDFHLTKLGLAYGPASNGETGFKIIKEDSEKKGSKRARFVGNPEVEKTFFNVANGSCTSCALSEAPKEDSIKEDKENRDLFIDMLKEDPIGYFYGIETDWGDEIYAYKVSNKYILTVDEGNECYYIDTIGEFAKSADEDEYELEAAYQLSEEQLKELFMEIRDKNYTLMNSKKIPSELVRLYGLEESVKEVVDRKPLVKPRKIEKPTEECKEEKTIPSRVLRAHRK